MNGKGAEMSIERRLEQATNGWLDPEIVRTYDLDTVVGSWERDRERQLLESHGYAWTEEQHLTGRYRGASFRQTAGLTVLLPLTWERYGGRLSVTYRRQPG